MDVFWGRYLKAQSLGNEIEGQLSLSLFLSLSLSPYPVFVGDDDARMRSFLSAWVSLSLNLASLLEFTQKVIRRDVQSLSNTQASFVCEPKN
jgi:hypothetical protein